MSRRLTYRFLVAFLLLIAGLAAAPMAAADNEPAIPRESADRVLNRIPDYAGGKPSPNILYSTKAVGEATNGPAGSTSRPSAAASGNTSHASTHLAPSKLRGGTITPGTITPGKTVPQAITPKQITPQQIVSPWGQ